jgi:hypothetical protein
MTESPISSNKTRHGCLTAYLVFMIIANSATALIYLTSSDAIRENEPSMPEWAFPVLIVACIVNLACAIALFKWKKWGFWGFTSTACLSLFVNLSIGLSPASAAGGLLGIAILYGVLQIGKENKGWSQLD